MRKRILRLVRDARGDRLWLRLSLCAAVIGLLVWIAGSDGAMAEIQSFFAHTTAATLNLLGEKAAVDGNTVETERFGISIVTACTGLFLTGLFATAVIVYPARSRSKLIGVGIGVCGIFAVNVVRLVTLYYVGAYLPGMLDTVHLLVWQSLLIAFAVALWLLWAGRASRVSRSEAT